MKGRAPQLPMAHGRGVGHQPAAFIGSGVTVVHKVLSQPFLGACRRRNNSGVYAESIDADLGSDFDLEKEVIGVHDRVNLRAPKQDRAVTKQDFDILSMVFERQVRERSCP